MAPVVKALESADGIESVVCLTGQHREMLEQVVRLFGIAADTNLEIMGRARGLSEITNAILTGMDRVLEEFRPDWILVHGDTTTTMASALAAFYRQIPVGHVEAGLRTGNMLSPWPEEMNRKVTGVLAGLHFAPTGVAKANLLGEGVPGERISVTGNTVIDALYWVRDNALTARGDEIAAQFPFLDPAKRTILVTGHRRENQDGGIARVCEAMRAIAARGDVQVVYPVHLNPAVKESVEAVLSGVDDVHLIAPADYLPFVWLMNRSAVIVTDSGGIQEEAPSLGKPVLVTRDTTERPEAVESGVVKLIGTDADAIAVETARLLDDPVAYDAMAQAQNPYGDGNASARIVTRLMEEA